YKRNYIEGLFLSSGIIRSGDYTMEEMVRVARTLREVHHFRGYIHLKLIPEASPALVLEAGLYADRVSINIELPKDESLTALAPEKDVGVIKKAMGGVRLAIEERAPQKKDRAQPRKYVTGQSTQLIVGADEAADGDILARSENLYGSYGLKRVYYSAFSPIPDSSSRLPPQKPPLMREHRLYQADWLMRYYGFERAEIAGPGQNLDLAVDPKLAWALANRDRFPIDVNTGDREMLLRIPGLGVKSVDSLVVLRRQKRVRLDDLKKLCGSEKKLRPFVIADDWTPGPLADADDLKPHLPREAAPQQLSLF
ncbi:MAG: putative DNA modification/repair radical SAM protein, partial [Caulobacter sp.]